jgi:hypothetical protein
MGNQISTRPSNYLPSRHFHIYLSYVVRLERTWKVRANGDGQNGCISLDGLYDGNTCRRHEAA